MLRLLFLCWSFLILGGYLFAQYIAPRQPDDNITGVFTESPLTWQFQQLSTDSIFLRGYGVVWDTVQKAWGDTVALLEQSAEPYQGGLKFVETTRSKSPDGRWMPSRRAVVHKPSIWASNQKTKPDSVFHFTWDAGLANWALQKKIVYAKDSAGYVAQRAIFLFSHVVADTLEQFVVDEYWDHPWRIRLVFDAQNGSYKLIDSTLYAFVNDTFCPTTIIFDFQSGQKKPFRRYDFQFFNILNDYELRTDYWSEAVDFWQAFSKENQIVVPDQFWISKQYLALISSYKRYKSTQEYYYDDWSPKKFDYEFFPSFEAFPDSVVRRDYMRDSLTGLISAIIERFQPKYEYVEFFNRFKWEFAWGAAPTVSADSPPTPLTKVRISRLNKNIFLLDFGQEEATGKKHLNLFDTSGKQLKTWSATGNTMQIDLSMCPAGVFYLHIADGRSSQTVPLFVVY